MMKAYQAKLDTFCQEWEFPDKKEARNRSMDTRLCPHSIERLYEARQAERDGWGPLPYPLSPWERGRRAGRSDGIQRYQRVEIRGLDAWG